MFEVLRSGKESWLIKAGEEQPLEEVDTTRVEDRDGKEWTACYLTVAPEGDTSMLKGSNTEYTQGIWYSEDGKDEGSKLVSSSVTVVVAVEGYAASLVAAVGAVAVSAVSLAL